MLTCIIYMYTYLLIRIVYAFETILSHYEWWRPTVGELFEGFQLESLGWRTASCQLSNLNPVLERGKGSELSVEQCPFFLFHEGFHFLGFSWEYWSTFSQLYPMFIHFPLKNGRFFASLAPFIPLFPGKKMAMAMFLGSPPRWLMVLAIAPRAPECHGGKGCIHMALWKIWKNDDVLV